MSIKVVFHENLYKVSTHDPATAAGRMEAIIDAIKTQVEWVKAEPSTEADIQTVHTTSIP